MMKWSNFSFNHLYVFVFQVRRGGGSGNWPLLFRNVLSSLRMAWSFMLRKLITGVYVPLLRLSLFVTSFLEALLFAGILQCYNYIGWFVVGDCLSISLHWFSYQHAWYLSFGVFKFCNVMNSDVSSYIV